MNPVAPTCPRCKAVLTSTAGGWVCPVCALENSLGAGGGDVEPEECADAFPRSFGGYELLGQIGSGGMGVVFKARQTSLGRIVALKVLVEGIIGDTAGRRRFRAEAEAAARLQHPNIVTVHEVGEHDGVPYLTMDLVDGPDLARLCDGRPLAADHAARLLREVTEAVKAAHAAGVIHRDLKPSNVLVGSDGRPRVTDFGLAKCVDDGQGESLTTAGRAVGSPSYAAPEQAAGMTDKVSVRSDVYGLGALLYHLLTGRAPFVAATALQTLRQVLESEVVPPRTLNPGVPRDLETICLKCLQKDPLRRYASASELGEDLARYLGQRPILARPPSLWYRSAKFVRRYRAGVAATAGVILALVVGLGVAIAEAQRAVRHRRVADAARREAERLNELVVQDLQPTLEQYGKLPVLKKTAEETVAYYERLPAELRSADTDAEQAGALELLARLRGMSQGDWAGGAAALDAAYQLREKVTRAHPDDPEAAAALLWNRSLYAGVAGDKTVFRSEAYHSRLVEQWRVLAARFPSNYRVRLGLGRALTDYSVGALAEGKTEAAIAVSAEARALIEQLAALRPDDLRLRELAEWNTWMYSRTLQVAGKVGEASESEERELARLESRLKDDPGNLSLRYLAAQAARCLSYRVTGPRMREAELIAREHYRILLGLDPGNRLYRFGFAAAHMMEPIYLAESDGRTQPARDLLALHVALLEELEPARGTDNIREELRRSQEYLARWAARGGDFAAARRHLAKQLGYVESNETVADGGALHQMLLRFNWRHTCAWVAWYGRDWGELERLADSTLAEIQRGLQQYPDNGNMVAFRKFMQAWRGIALERQGRAAEACALLEATLVAKLERPATPYGPYGDDANLTWLVVDALAPALARAGDLANARQIAEGRLAWSELNWREGWSWYSRERFAHVLVLMGSLLDPADPAEAVRREKCLKRAATLLQCPEAEGRISPYGRATLDWIGELRAVPRAGTGQPPS